MLARIVLGLDARDAGLDVALLVVRGHRDRDARVHGRIVARVARDLQSGSSAVVPSLLSRADRGARMDRNAMPRSDARHRGRAISRRGSRLDLAAANRHHDTHVGKELVSGSFTLRRSRQQSPDHDTGENHFFRFAVLFDTLKTLVGNWHASSVWRDRAERIVSRVFFARCKHDAHSALSRATIPTATAVGAVAYLGIRW